MRKLRFAALLAALALAPRLHAQGAIEGTAYDSLRGVPLGHASVVVRPAIMRDTSFRSALTDNKGHFQLQGLPEGKYLIVVDHEAIDSIGFHIPDITVEVAYLKTTIVSIATPSARTLRSVLCPDIADDRNSGVMLGTVRAVDGSPLAHATVVFSWNDFEVDAPSLYVINHKVTSSAVADDNGVYRKCGVPLERAVFAQAQASDRVQSGILEEHVGKSGMQVRDFRLAAERVAVVPGAADSAPVVQRTALVTGRVIDVGGRPIPSAQVILAGNSRNVTTNDAGEFRLADVPAGTQSLEVIALGYYPVSVRVETDRLAEGVIVRLERAAVILDSLRVIAKRTTRARLLSHEEFEGRRLTSGGGHYITRAQLDSMRPLNTYDALRRVQGITLSRGNMSEVIISSSRGASNLDAITCPMDLYLDGIRIKQEDVRGIPPEVIYGIEVHGVATVPARYKNSMCGAVFFWTR
jgi:hypothetical protein